MLGIIQAIRHCWTSRARRAPVRTVVTVRCRQMALSAARAVTATWRHSSAVPAPKVQHHAMSYRTGSDVICHVVTNRRFLTFLFKLYIHFRNRIIVVVNLLAYIGHSYSVKIQVNCGILIGTTSVSQSVSQSVSLSVCLSVCMSVTRSERNARKHWLILTKIGPLFYWMNILI